jgi:hypothetical protein
MKTRTALALIAFCSAPVACGAPPDDVASTSASALTPASGWNAAWDEPAPQLRLGNQPFAVIQDNDLDATNHLFWLNSNYTTDFAVQSGSGWTVPLNLSGTLYGMTAARASGGFFGEFVVGVAPSGSVWMNINDSDLTANGGSTAAAWSGWFGIGGYAASYTPAMVVQGDIGHVFVIGGNDQVWHTWGETTSNSWTNGWQQLGTLPGGHTATPSANALSATIRGGNNVPFDRNIDIAVIGSGGTVWHMEFNVTSWTGTWEQAPSTILGNPALGITMTSTDANTVDIFETSAGGPGLFASSSPGSWVTLPVPQSTGACADSGFQITSSAPGEMDLYEKTTAGLIYHDHYGPSPSTAPGLTYCH